MSATSSQEEAGLQSTVAFVAAASGRKPLSEKNVNDAPVKKNVTKATIKKKSKGDGKKKGTGAAQAASPFDYSDIGLILKKDYRLARSVSTKPRSFREAMIDRSVTKKLLAEQEDKLVQWIRRKRLLLGERPGKDHKAIREKATEFLKQRNERSRSSTPKEALGIHWVRHFIQRRPDLQVVEHWAEIDPPTDVNDEEDEEDI